MLFIAIGICIWSSDHTVITQFLEGKSRSGTTVGYDCVYTQHRWSLVSTLDTTFIPIIFSQDVMIWFSSHYTTGLVYNMHLLKLPYNLLFYNLFYFCLEAINILPRYICKTVMLQVTHTDLLYSHKSFRLKKQ